MNKSIVAMLGGVGVAATVALLGAPIAAAGRRLLPAATRVRAASTTLRGPV